MQQKITWMSSLALGIIIFMTCAFSTCCRDCAGKIVKLKWIYINETSYDISLINGKESFNVAPFDTTVFENELEGVTKEVICGVSFTNTPEMCSERPCIISYSGVKCDTLFIDIEDKIVRDICRYECKEIDDTHFEFTFRYTQSDYNHAKDCN